MKEGKKEGRKDGRNLFIHLDADVLRWKGRKVSKVSKGKEAEEAKED